MKDQKNFEHVSSTNSDLTDSTKFSLPQLTLRRLWALNDGQIKLPSLPKLLSCW